ncbi:hypothetical protein [Achromobacter anxifer]|uniref:hypothetical protein n=1 Tax=Achromobacter anxifer TaxID=1287737 RepID=UPI001590B74C|nr:hypothetical protein [Achromobacter anxifer]
MFHKFLCAISRTSAETRLAAVAGVIGAANIWGALLVAMVAVWRYCRRVPLDFSRGLAFWFFAPTAITLVFIGMGKLLPDDDLLRHLTAGGLSFDYRAQYPWSELPKANLWLGFDWALWQLQSLGLSKEFLRQWLPALSLVLQSLVLFFALKRMLPAHRQNPSLLLLCGALGMLLLTPRSVLGRPEMFILIFAACAWLPRSIMGVLAWIMGFLILVPSYWLGWAYAPFALLLWRARLSLVQRVGIAAGLGLAHLGFWQWYTGDYLQLMVWLKGTLSVKATENRDLLYAFYTYAGFVLLGLLTFAASVLNRQRLIASASVVMLFAWFAIPNQIRYLAALSFIALPWIYRQLTIWSTARSLHIPPVVVLLALGAAGLCVTATPTVPTFALKAADRVYSESPYATVFFGQKGISVDPSFALGATKAPWDGLKKSAKESEHCQLLREGGFTHVVEMSRNSLLECGELVQVQGAWRLWRLK